MSDRNGASLWGSFFGIGFQFPRRYEETRSAGADGSGLALFERSEFSQTPAAPSIAVCPRSGTTNPARLSFGYFSLAKQRKVPRPPGRDPASPAGQAHRRAKARNSPQDPTNYPFAALIMSAAFSAIMITGALVLPATTLGMMGASNPLAQAHFSLEICVLVRLAPHWTRFNIDNKAILHYCLCIIQTTVKTP